MADATPLRFKPVAVFLVSFVTLLFGLNLVWSNLDPPLRFDTPLVLAVVMLAMVVFWVVQFIDLMRHSEDAFAARSDKLIWAAVFVLVFPLAPLAFWLWKQSRQQPSQ